MGELSVFIGSFLSIPIFTADVEFSKTANSATAVGSYTHIVVFVWRQLEFAFFGALTSVGALFILLYYKRRCEMGFMDKFGGNILQGMMGNLSEVTPEKLTNDYGMYLMEEETIHTGFVLIRDVVIFTDKRIIDLDKQGATGQKARVSSIYLDSIINVSAETAGFGIDDSELNIEYISSPYFRSNGGVSVSSRKFEFSKKYQIQSIYRWLQEIAYTNHLHINR